MEQHNRDSAEALTHSRPRFDIPRTFQWDMRSRAENRPYRIFLSIPPGEPPETGYPVIYLLDANSVFGTMAEAVRLQSGRPDKTGVVPAVVVGIGYRTDTPFGLERYYDLTPAPSDRYTRKPDGTPLPEQGGAAAFLQFIEEDLKPLIERETAIDRGRQTIFGHSLGGLFVLYALFAKPHAFRHYVAGSPSVHWIPAYMEEAEQSFVSRLARERVQADVLIAMGGLERGHVSGNFDSARALAERLSAYSGRGLKVLFREFEDEGHVSVLPPLISRALRFALQPEA
ncbi:alpha/beta hydrolase [Paenibacillus thermoaerophilus]|uniref:Alpha/beta hydrolase n=1 Tax=Paenibacillus thermoaerophilus TaxID=1215385 RepID=A0ABW2V4L3_9BACL|nr:alpha/beta hydrolase-fold protein [Paenibacillus thermoaerophilus]TMV07341.1 alpha/beta hydrolase [Paenibacillus thermoaerophilus]